MTPTTWSKPHHGNVEHRPVLEGWHEKTPKKNHGFGYLISWIIWNFHEVSWMFPWLMAVLVSFKIKCTSAQISQQRIVIQWFVELHLHVTCLQKSSGTNGRKRSSGMLIAPVSCSSEIWARDGPFSSWTYLLFHLCIVLFLIANNVGI